LSPAYDPASWLGAVVVALAYAVALAGIGAWSLRVVAGDRWPALAPTRLAAATWSFVFGQGVVGVAWLVAGLWLRITTSAVWAVIGIGLLAAALALPRRGAATRRLPAAYRVAASAVTIIAILGVAGALLPTRNDDALRNYVVMAQIIAHEGRVTFQAANPPMFGLFPLGQELHWAALLRVGNMASASVFDAFGSAATLAAVAVLAASRGLGRRVQTAAVAVMAGIPAYATLAGMLKVDNASTAFGVMAFAALFALRATARGALLSGLMLGFALGNRLTDALLVPAWLFALWQLRNDDEGAAPWLSAAAGALLSAGPAFLKNWILVRAPFAPLLGGEDEYWSHAFAWRALGNNLRWPDVPILPFLWTLGERPMMMGTISPLFLGLLPAAWIFRRAPVVRRAALAGALAAVALGTTVIGQPLSLHTRHHFVALALLAVLVGAVFVRLASALRRKAWIAWAPVAGLLALWMAAGTWRTYEAALYVTGRRTAGAHYARARGFRVATWLNASIPAQSRVALSRYLGYRSLVRPDILAGSESRSESQASWEARGGNRAGYDASEWREAAARGFEYVLVATGDAEHSLAAWPGSRPARVAYSDTEYTVIRLRD
jgi:hypothetical protein